MTAKDKPQRFVIVSDSTEFTVWDNDQQRDWFPTRSGNRDYACKCGCDSTTAQVIADALNFYVKFKSRKRRGKARKPDLDDGFDEAMGIGTDDD